jgi:hypothetical protein
LKEEANSPFLRTVPREKAFYFFTSVGNYTGENATSFKEFLERIGEVNVKSLEFHLYRGDLEKWVTEVLEDNKLAEEIGRLQKSSLSGEPLRSQLYATVQKRYRILTDSFSQFR